MDHGTGLGVYHGDTHVSRDWGEGGRRPPRTPVRPDARRRRPSGGASIPLRIAGSLLRRCSRQANLWGMMEDAVPEGESASTAAAETKAVGALEETPCGPTPAAADSGVCVVEQRPSPRCRSAANIATGVISPVKTSKWKSNSLGEHSHDNSDRC
jgi:hypothetical protein